MNVSVVHLSLAAYWTLGMILYPMMVSLEYRLKYRKQSFEHPRQQQWYLFFILTVTIWPFVVPYCINETIKELN